jgi:pyridoxamine 5'-phosphate oxidase
MGDTMSEILPEALPAADPAVDPAPLRRTYGRDGLTEASIAGTWLEQLTIWFGDAVRELADAEPNAMQVATVDADGRPSVRTVLMKAFDERGVVFYTNYDSAKGRDLDARPYAAAVLAWVTLERQIRVTGRVSRVSAGETAAYFHSRPRGSQLGAWASAQSAVVPSRAVLDDQQRAVEARFAGMDVPVPPHWGGYLISPDSVEFWQGRPDRLHDRLRFRQEGQTWLLERLAP